VPPQGMNLRGGGSSTSSSRCCATSARPTGWAKRMQPMRGATAWLKLVERIGSLRDVGAVQGWLVTGIWDRQRTVCGFRFGLVLVDGAAADVHSGRPDSQHPVVQIYVMPPLARDFSAP